MKYRINGLNKTSFAFVGISLTAAASLLVSCVDDDMFNYSVNSKCLSFDVEVNDAVESMTRSGIKPNPDGFFPTSSLELRSDDSTVFYANCEERNGIHMHYDTDNNVTRGEIKTLSNFYTSFKLYGYVYDQTDSWASLATKTVDSNINGITVTQSGTSWPTSITWPGANKEATFFAIAPNDAASITSNTGNPSFTYTVPATADTQKDLLVAKSTDVSCDGKSAPTLSFNHILSAIKFTKGTITPFTSITKVEITGVNNAGTYSMEDGSWSGQSGSTTYTLTSFTDNDVLFLMPQTITSGATLKITLSNGTTSRTYSTSLTGSWLKGNQYTYNIAVNEIKGDFHLDVTTSTDYIPQSGGTAKINVKSYFEYGSGTKVPIEWTGTYNNGTTTQTISGSGNTSSGENRTVTISKNTSSSTAHTTTLQNATAKGTTAAPFNLADPEGTGSDQNTANCYVVSAPGVYKLPLVYGNGIKNGVPNTDCYDAGGSFVNHAGTNISSLMPYIIGHGYDPTVAEVVWTSSTNLVTSPTISGKYLVFTIDKANICQGNVVIAAKYNGTIVWSWHIWVTDIPLMPYTYGNYKFMNMALGFVNTESSMANTPKNIEIKFSQPEANRTNNWYIPQAGDKLGAGSCMFYQFGRKDPIDGPTLVLAEQAANYQASIISPTTFFRYGGSEYGNWYSDVNQLGLWSTGNTLTTNDVTTSKKTIYDPCPVGYKIPPPQAFITVSNSLDFSELEQCQTDLGICVNDNPNDFWQILGIIREKGFLDPNKHSIYWSCIPTTSTLTDLYGGTLGMAWVYWFSPFFNPGINMPTNHDVRSRGHSVRPVTE